MADSVLVGGTITGKTTPVGADSLYLVDSADLSSSANGTTKALTVGNLTTYLNSNLSFTPSSVSVLTNKTFDTAGAGNVLKINGTAISAITGTGSVVLATSPTLVTPVLGVATVTSINKVTITAPASSATLALINGTTVTGPASTDTLVGKATTDTLTNKTLTDSTNTIGPASLISFNCPQGFMINGKITTSVSSNNLTVAIKGLNGSDPSATNPVYVNIGGTIRTITAALSVTKNAATNWFNSGASETATLEIDYFVYLGFNATDGVVLGFARRPDAFTYSDFSVTTTNPNYAAISTIAHAANTDNYENIGRFNAILSATASFNWSIPGTSIIINRPIFETRFLSWTPTYTGGGSLTVSAITTNSALYKIRGSSKATCLLQLDTNLTTGGVDNTTIFATIPVTALSTTNNGPNGIADINSITGKAIFNTSTKIGMLKDDTANIGLAAIYVKADVEAPI